MQKGGGADDCYQRNCCLQKEIECCWQCESSPCDKGFSDPNDKVWSGLCRGFISCIKFRGIEEFAGLVQSRLGKTIEYGQFRFKSEEEIVESVLQDSSHS